MCQRCHRRPARYHVSRTVNGETVEELDLCEHCAAETGELPAAIWQQDPHTAIAQWLAGLLGEGAATPETGEQPAEQQADRCPHCGLTFAEFARTGLLGCPECYQSFQAQLSSLIRRMHGASHHEGKSPARAGQGLRKRHARDDLKRQLAEAIATEAFEKAAVLRDQIRGIEAESDQGSA